jgi:hypothetical protein
MRPTYRFFESVNFGPHDLQLAQQAFDEAWLEIAGNYGRVASIERARTRLACIVLTIVNDGDGIEVAPLKEAALQAMKIIEEPIRFAGGEADRHASESSSRWRGL